MRDINTDAASGHPQLCSLQNESEDRIRFTPVKRAADIIPRVWDRKPSTSYLAKSSRPRKVWKRFRTSFNSMKALQQIVDAASKRIEEDDLNTEINSSRNSSLLRGLKRRCLDAGQEENAESGAGGRRRSFLETKWESEIQKRRKLPMNREIDIMNVEHNDCRAESEQQPVTSIADVDTQKDELAGVDMDPAYPEMLHGSSDKDECNDIDPASEAATDDATEEKTNDIITMDEPLPEALKKETAPAEEIISAEQESTLVRSALRSSLDVDDAEVLNNFLTKAKAKRAAKAAMAAQEQTTTEEKPVQEEEAAIPNLPTPRSRRALEELDANSPSPSPQKVTSARKAEDVSGSPVSKNVVPKGDEAKNSLQKQPQQQQQQQPASPTATRRSTRTRTPRAPPKSNIPTPQNTLSLRRAKGNEFVFLQRTEAQELALVTRKNTKNNKGNSVLPKYTLQTLSKGQWSAEASPSSDSSSGNGGRTGKRVCWNDARLVEYEDGEESQATASASPEPTGELSDSTTRAGPGANVNKKGNEKQKTSSNRSTRSQTTVITMPQSPAARRVRRLGSQATTTTSTKPEAAPSSSCKGIYTASSTRKKLTPKAPSSGLLGTPPSKKSVSIATSTTTIGSSAGTATGGRETSAKSKSIFKANAGSTPMPKRVRSRA